MENTLCLNLWRQAARTKIPELSDGFRGELVTTKCCTCGNGCIRVRNFSRFVVSFEVGKDHRYVKDTSAKEDRGYTTCSAVVFCALPFPEHSDFQIPCTLWPSLEMFSRGLIRSCTRRT